MLFFFFFSSRRRHTRSLCDWSSDVCSSDLIIERLIGQLGDLRAVRLHDERLEETGISRAGKSDELTGDGCPTVESSLRHWSHWGWGVARRNDQNHRRPARKSLRCERHKAPLKKETGQASSSLSRFRDLLPSRHRRPKRGRLGDQRI